MKALQLVPAMDEGGVERYVVALNRMLVSAGWGNVVVSRGGRLDSSVTAGGGRIVHMDMKSKNPLTAFSRALRLRRILRRERPDVVCAHSRVPAWLFVMASKGLGVRWMTYAHGANSVSRYSRVMTRGDVIMCPSNFVREYLMAAYGTAECKFRVVPHGIDPVRFDPASVDQEFVAARRREWGVGGDTKVVMAIGRITRLKGFDTLIRAISRLVSGGAHGAGRMKLVIVGGAEGGKESYLAELRALARELGVGETVVFAGRQERIPECLYAADVVVSANTHKPESFGLTMAEALMMGKPVVAKAFGGALDIVRDGLDGVLVKGGQDDASAFADAIVKTLSSSFDGLRTAALARFDVGKMSERTLSVYGELVRMPGRGH